MSAVVERRVSERRRVGIDFSLQPELQDRGETIVSVISVVSEPPGLTIGSPDHNGQCVQVVIEGGLAGTRYRVVFTVETSGGSRLVGEGTMKVIAD